MSSTMSGGSNGRDQSNRITVAEWQAALEQAMRRSEHVGGITATELAASLGVSIATARSRLRLAAGCGLIRCVGRRPEERIDGQRKLVPVYQLVRATRRKGTR